MTTHLIEKLDSEIAQLAPQDQLKLVSLVSARLSTDVLPRRRAPLKRKRKQNDRESLLAELKATANINETQFATVAPVSPMQIEQWWNNEHVPSAEILRHFDDWLAACEDLTSDLTGPFDSAAEVRRMREER